MEIAISYTCPVGPLTIDSRGEHRMSTVLPPQDDGGDGNGASSNRPEGGSGRERLLDTKLEYLLEEQKQRRQEIENGIARVDGDFRFAVVVVGAFWSWFATDWKDWEGELSKLIALLPLFITCFFWFRSLAIRKSIVMNAEYMQEVEVRFGVAAEGLGWETWVMNKRKEDKDSGKGHLARTADWFWLVLVVVNILLLVGLAQSKGWLSFG